MATSSKDLQQYDQIGGWLWFPALWTITNFFVGCYIAIYSPVVGGILLALAVPNAWLFWSKKKVYRWYFILHSFASLTLLVAAFGPQGVGGGVVWTLIFMVYLIFSKRARGTFTRPLFSKEHSSAVES